MNTTARAVLRELNVSAIQWLALCFLAVVIVGCAHGPRYPVFIPAIGVNQPLDSSDNFARALESRWTMDRISLFCKKHRPEEITGLQGAKLNSTDWSGQIHQGQRLFSSIMFIVRVKEGRPEEFHLTVSQGRRAWQLEAGSIAELRKNRMIGYSR